MSFKKELDKNTQLEKRRHDALRKILLMRERFDDCSALENQNIQIFCAGSLGRKDIGSKSDLDLFFITSDNEFGKINEIKIFSKVIEINKELKYPEFSNDGQFLKIHDIGEMTSSLGNSDDDHQNYFTTRMLLLLESTHLFNETLYKSHIKKILSHYFRDREGHSAFEPVFVMNDILRYWRTLCLNYESIRNDGDRPWRKKNINLKFSRALSVYGTILPLITKPIKEIDEFIELTKKSPLERMAVGLDHIDDNSMKEGFSEFLEIYEEFLGWKEEDDIEKLMRDSDLRNNSRTKARIFTKFIFQALMHSSIDERLKRYLVI